MNAGALVEARMLAWAGHVARMDENALQRCLLFSWVENARARGRPQKTFGERLHHALQAMPAGPLAAMSSRSGRGREKIINRWAEKAKDRQWWHSEVVVKARWDRYGARPRLNCTLP